MIAGYHWTKEENAQLTDMCKAGKSISDMAKTLNRTPESVAAQKCKLGLITKNYQLNAFLANTDAHETVRQMLQQGAFWKEIAAKVNATPYAVEELAHKHGWKRQWKPATRVYTSEQIERVRVLYCELNWPVEDIAKDIHTCTRKIGYICRHYGFISKTAPRYWTPNETNKLIELLNAKKDIDEISEVLNRTDVAIVYRCEKLKIQRSYPTIMARKALLKNARVTIEKSLKWKIREASRRAKRTEMDFDLTLETMMEIFAKQSGRCYYTGVNLSPKPNSAESISIDRVDSTRGYTQDNVVLCIWDINRMKQDLPMDRFVKLCSVIATNWVQKRAA